MSGSCRHTRAAPAAAGLLHSQVFPGLRLAVAAMLQNDHATVLREQQRALGEAAHQTFVARLAGGSPTGKTAD